MAIYKRALRTFDTSSLTASFQNVGSTIPFVTNGVTIINPSDVEIFLTDQSTQEDIRVPASTTVNIGIGLNNSRNVDSLYVFKKNTQLQIKQVTAAGTGTIVIICVGDS